MKETFLKFVGVFVAVVALALFGAWAFGKFSPSTEGNLGTALTINTQNQSYVDGADFRQNVQAMAERMAGVSQYQVLQADSAGNMQAVSPSALAGTTWDLDGLRAGNFVTQGSVASYTATSSVTASELCGSGLLSITATSDTPQITLPSTTTLFSACLSTNGDSLSIPVLNASSVTNTKLLAGLGGTLLKSSSTSIGPSLGGTLRVIRDASQTYKAMLFNVN